MSLSFLEQVLYQSVLGMKTKYVILLFLSIIDSV